MLPKKAACTLRKNEKVSIKCMSVYTIILLSSVLTLLECAINPFGMLHVSVLGLELSVHRELLVVVIISGNRRTQLYSHDYVVVA